MQILEFNINVPEDRIVTLTLSKDVVPGEHFVVMAIEDSPEKTESIELQAFLEGINDMSELEEERKSEQRAEFRRKLEVIREVQLWDDVALLEDMTALDLTTSEPLLLRRGQQGRVILRYNRKESEVEFETKHGYRYASLRLPDDKLLILRDEPEAD